MNVENIIKLVDAGFTKAEIAALVSETPTEAPKPPVDIKDQPAPVDIKDQPAEGINKDVAAALANINSTLEKLQTFALKTDAQPGKQTTDFKAILSSVYNKKE